MLSYFELKKKVKFILEGEPYEVLDFRQMKKAQDVVVAQTKIKNLVTGKIIERNFHQGETFEEAGLEKVKVKFIYSRMRKFYFSEAENSAKRFELSEEQIGLGAKFLTEHLVLDGLKFKEKVINVSLPIKVQLKVVEAPPGVKGNRSQAGTKTVTLETGAKINVPLFIQVNDLIEINTENGEYVRRVEIK
ncbi:hypothetical protein AMJ49_07015 [Parcubacteria bacterium DG_74_2]|nr:MAG: hypothetical protein AMJ49_07015 [Parcubacteria bacterium DG_74_2]